MTELRAHLPATGAGPAFDKRLDTIGWAIFLILTGVIWLLPEGQVPRGAWFMATGILLLGLNAIRAYTRASISGFTTILGALALAAGLAAYWGVELPIFAIGMIVMGLAILLRQVVGS